MKLVFDAIKEIQRQKKRFLDGIQRKIPNNYDTLQDKKVTLELVIPESKTCTL